MFFKDDALAALREYMDAVPTSPEGSFFIEKEGFSSIHKDEDGNASIRHVFLDSDEYNHIYIIDFIRTLGVYVPKDKEDETSDVVRYIRPEDVTEWFVKAEDINNDKYLELAEEYGYDPKEDIVMFLTDEGVAEFFCDWDSGYANYIGLQNSIFINMI